MKTGHDWDINQARNLYKIHQWGEGYFDINEQGNLVVLPSKTQTEQELTLKDIVSKAKAHGLNLPLLIRFPEILQDRIHQLRAAFEKAMKVFDYRSSYQAVYPIKVNQQRRVIKEMLSVTPHIGLESGSKAELMAIMALFEEKSGLIVCNGYKDRETIRLALIGQALGHKVLIILEKQSELDLVLQEAQKLGQKPCLGIRVRLNSVSLGKWQNTGGEKSKFGLTAQQCLEVIQQLKQNNCLDCLTTIHAHLGSQVANIKDIEKGMKEVARLYQTFHALGAYLDTVDVGGGLGVDYEGTQSQSFCSINYSMDHYAHVVVAALAQICGEHQLPHPNIITESGRAMTAHHAVLVTEIIDQDVPFKNCDMKLDSLSEQNFGLVQWFQHKIDSVELKSAKTTFEQAQNTLSEVQQLFLDGALSFQGKALAEMFYYKLCQHIKEVIKGHVDEQLELWNAINLKTATKYFCNFSIFQSLPDVWAIDQIFPILPVEGLESKPNHRALIKDITCDSDGRIDDYVDGMGLESTLPLPSVQLGSLLAVFMVGAYQEILGDMHNLFGDTDSVHVKWSNNGYHLVEPLLGDRVESVLRAVQFEPYQMLQSYKRQINKSSLESTAKQAMLGWLCAALSSSTYLDKE